MNSGFLRGRGARSRFAGHLAGDFCCHFVPSFCGREWPSIAGFDQRSVNWAHRGGACSGNAQGNGAFCPQMIKNLERIEYLDNNFVTDQTGQALLISFRLLIADHGSSRRPRTRGRSSSGVSFWLMPRCGKTGKKRMHNPYTPDAHPMHIAPQKSLSRGAESLRMVNVWSA